MQTPSVADAGVVPQRSTLSVVARAKAHECFRGTRLLLGALMVSLMIWVSLVWALKALMQGF